MVKGLYTAWTGMVNEQKRLDVLANNLANADTTGYKKEGTVAQSFDNKLALKIKDTSYANGYAVQRLGGVTLGVKIGETYTDWSQGSFEITDNDTDLAIAGKGFFAISFTDANGNQSIKYTRDGGFVVDREGYLRTTDGDYVLNMQGARNSQNTVQNRVKVDPLMPFTVDQQGYIYQDNQQVGQVGLVDFENYDYISKYGENLYDLVDGGAIIDATGQIEQGCLESSNVNVVDEMVDMIAIARAYEAGQKVIQTEDTELGQAVQTVGRV